MTTGAVFYSPPELLSYRRFHYFPLSKTTQQCKKKEKKGKIVGGAAFQKYNIMHI